MGLAPNDRSFSEVLPLCCSALSRSLIARFERLEGAARSDVVGKSTVAKRWQIAQIVGGTPGAVRRCVNSLN
jgi:hypothetical protein